MNSLIALGKGGMQRGGGGGGAVKIQLTLVWLLLLTGILFHFPDMGPSEACRLASVFWHFVNVFLSCISRWEVFY